VIFSGVYLLAPCLLSCLMVRGRHELSKDAELLVLRQENGPLRRPIGRVRCQHGGGGWRHCPRLIPRRRRGEVFAVTPAALLAWHRRLAAGKGDHASRRRPGRASTAAAIRTLVIRIATGNPAWGHRRVHGELIKLGHRIAASTVWQILQDARINPSAPARPAQPGGSSWPRKPAASSPLTSCTWTPCCRAASTP
jgi:putative transposase